MPDSNSKSFRTYNWFLLILSLIEFCFFFWATVLHDNLLGFGIFGPFTLLTGLVAVHALFINRQGGALRAILHTIAVPLIAFSTLGFLLFAGAYVAELFGIRFMN